MPNTVNLRVLDDGARYYVAHLYLESDGVEGDITNQVLVDQKQIPGLPGWGSPVGKLSVDKLWPSLSGFDLMLSFASMPDQPIWVVTPYSKHVSFVKVAGLKDAGGLDAPGQLLFSTSGFASAGDRGSLIIRVRKG